MEIRVSLELPHDIASAYEWRYLESENAQSLFNPNWRHPFQTCSGCQTHFQAFLVSHIGTAPMGGYGRGWDNAVLRTVNPSDECIRQTMDMEVDCIWHFTWYRDLSQKSMDPRSQDSDTLLAETWRALVLEEPLTYIEEGETLPGSGAKLLNKGLKHKEK